MFITNLCDAQGIFFANEPLLTNFFFANEPFLTNLPFCPSPLLRNQRSGEWRMRLSPPALPEPSAQDVLRAQSGDRAAQNRVNNQRSRIRKRERERERILAD